ncbi:endonuclease/exonuclease/phosphatase family protein [Emticicia sp. 17c]|uniref:endonuclease/exonuclease/phosphatase family protein n=1 Tax=Emticicia sp. 17c TaxID=3127704 RepID=UPI00301C7274
MRFLFVLLCLSMQAVFAQKEMNVMTYNIRLGIASDGDNQWANRRKNLASILTFFEVDICGMQEAFISQINDLEQLLPDKYGWVGKGRDDGKQAGEFSCIFYRKDKYTLLSTETFWLSEHPEKPGLGWEARYNRVVTYAKFERQADKKIFYVFNTHFDHEAVVARRESAKLLLARIKEIAGNTPTLITGDFNAVPSSEPIQILTDSNNPDHLLDTENLSESPHFGPYSSFTGFQIREQEGMRIDYIFVKNGDFKVRKHATISEAWNGKFASDHHPVMAVLAF